MYHPLTGSLPHHDRDVGELGLRVRQQYGVAVEAPAAAEEEIAGEEVGQGQSAGGWVVAPGAEATGLGCEPD